MIYKKYFCSNDLQKNISVVMIYNTRFLTITFQRYA